MFARILQCSVLKVRSFNRTLLVHHLAPEVARRTLCSFVTTHLCQWRTRCVAALGDRRAAADVDGVAAAQRSLGYLYHMDVAELDMQASLTYYRLAAEQGDARAQYNLGVCLQNGESVDQDQQEAVKYYRLAAEQGDADAACNLGCQVM